ncbi:nucleotidyl transferase AbiEii/AbiGii toxin family protein [Marinobacter sp. DUT-3]|uniref:nucleotidyl transferase AbiEii/AbiGii toxin family protein n=1 Tax=Marinobacter sp. DUT-3 TaxID=3412036 RepID=UPI003D172A38
MRNIARETAQQRQDLFAATSSKMTMTPAAAEKDFWVVWCLDTLFSLPDWASRLRFKGGTSLSKAYGVIERFSEDIDLILDWTGLSDENPVAGRSKTKQGWLNTSINQAAQFLIREQLLPDLQRALQPVCQASLDKDDPHTINIEYPALFAPGYLRPIVRLEIGPLAAMLPMESKTVASYAAQCFPQVFQTPGVEVPTIRAERTFWEKMTILHAEAHRPADKPLPTRYARHYYDVYRMASSQYAESALKDIELLAEVVAFKQKFYPAGWASYQTAKPGTMRLLPSDAHIRALEVDYDAMTEMVFGDVPEFESLLQVLEALEERINNQGLAEKL